MRKKKWYKSKTHTGWKAEMSAERRRSLALKAHKGNELSTARGLLALSNVQKRTNPKVSQKARADADYFFSKHKKG